MADFYASRKRRSSIVMSLCVAATGLGLAWLLIILATLLWNGVGGLSLAIFTQNTPPPNAQGGGLANAIAGSLVLTAIGTGVGAPIGLLAGTYMAEYGRYEKVTTLVRFINDILLSAPSIIVGLFIYGAVVVPMHGFSGIAGALALAVIVIPVVVRTTENMLLLVPQQLREAAAGLGLPQSKIIQKVAYKAARTGLVTGVLLAVARISGETAPLLFTTLSNQFWNLDLTREVANLPVTINNFINNPDPNWKRLAWAGALLITSAVLALNIGARTLSSRSAKK
ncbi:MAG: phosphate ABC transporter permease PstA [Beijerinckiaceae bacterium]